MSGPATRQTLSATVVTQSQEKTTCCDEERSGRKNHGSRQRAACLGSLITSRPGGAAPHDFCKWRDIYIRPGVQGCAMEHLTKEVTNGDRADIPEREEL